MLFAGARLARCAPNGIVCSDMTYFIAKSLIPDLQNMLGASKDAPTYLHEPRFEGNDKKYVLDAIDSTFVSSVGAYVDRFEEELAAYCGVKRAVVVVNGTAALHLALVACGVVAGDEVLMPALTFVATANAAAYQGATPHFCDSDMNTLGLCPVALEAHLAEIASLRDDGVCVNKETGRVIRAMVPMHCFGHPADMDALVAVAARYNIAVIEDAAESLGSFYKGTHTGGLGRVGTLSFNGNKTITTGGGGALLTNDEALGAHLKHISTTAKVSADGFFRHDMVGYNYRMPNLNAALGCAQLEQLPAYLEKKRALASRYRDIFSAYDEVDFIDEPEECQSNYWLCTARFKSPDALPEALKSAHGAGIIARPVWDLMNSLPMYKSCPKAALGNAQSLAKTIISLPSSPFLV